MSTKFASSRPAISMGAGVITLLALLIGCGPASVSSVPTGQGAPATATSAAAPSSEPAASDSAPEPSVSRTPGPTLPRVPPLQPPAYASRVVVEGLGIDLPVVSGDLQPPPNYPFCDVAAYVTRFAQPYESGVTYISAHAQRGMFAPLLAASERADGAELIGMRVQVFVSDGRQFDYVIERVVRHAVDYAVLAELPFDEQRLILQTSEGPDGTIEKLQVIAALEAESTVDPAVAAPIAMPRDCSPGELPAPTPS